MKTSASGCPEMRREETERGREEWRGARRREGLAVRGGVGTEASLWLSQFCVVKRGGGGNVTAELLRGREGGHWAVIISGSPEKPGGSRFCSQPAAATGRLTAPRWALLFGLRV